MRNSFIYLLIYKKEHEKQLQFTVSSLKGHEKQLQLPVDLLNGRERTQLQKLTVDLLKGNVVQLCTCGNIKGT